MVKLVERKLELHKQLPKAKTPHERESIERGRELETTSYSVPGFPVRSG
jgi:hypothetical protein